MSRKPFKGALCAAHLDLPGFRYGDLGCSCRRLIGHDGPHRARGFLEWNSGEKDFLDTRTGKRHLL